MKDSHFLSVGGEQDKLQFDDWVKTVRTKPAAIETTLAPLSDFMADANSFNAALQAYYDLCPRSDNGVCNGYGLCDPVTRECTCLPKSEREVDLCYPRPPCKHGRIQRGKCVCLTLDVGFSY